MRFLTARLATSVAVQMQTVAVGWQVYEITRDPLDLGLIGLSQFLPFVLLVLPAGHFADQHVRQKLLSACYGLELVCALLLLAFSLSGLSVVWPVFAVMVLFGVARAFAMPTGQALLPNLVPPALFGRAVAVNSTTWQLSTIAGPAIGGLVYLAGAPVVYGSVAALLALAVILMFGVKAPAPRRSAESIGLDSLLEGLRFVFRRRTILGAISLDLFAVLFGGATALLPAYASDILQVGPDGLGLLRAAPGVGAAVVALVLAWRPLTERVGPAMLWGVALFGLATVVFGISTSFLLSLAALAILGAADMVSVYIRHLLVQLETPDEIRGRVSAVSAVFIGASNELGEFESGVTAAWWGLRPAVVVGGVASVVIAGLWARWFPELRRLDRFGPPRA
ncbi:MAG: permease of the major facilitator superfamily [Proteobacteria bacterium]|nr:permease of the major facilitator superfamily [Pseudomonadota bacterium]